MTVGNQNFPCKCFEQNSFFFLQNFLPFDGNARSTSNHHEYADSISAAPKGA